MDGQAEYNQTELAQILVIEDRPTIARTLRDLLALNRYIVTLAYDWPTAELELTPQPPDLVIIDTHLPAYTSYQICTQIKENIQTSLVPVILVTDSYDQGEHLHSIAVGADDYICILSDSFLFEARVKALLQNKRRNDWLESAAHVIVTLARVAAARHTLSDGQIQRPGTYAVWLGSHLGLSPVELAAVNYGAIVQDVGILGVSEAILRKGYPLTLSERQQLERHTIIGEYIVQPLRMAPLIAPIVRSHHERWDGRGYPDGLAGEEIPLGARIVAVVNAFTTLTTPRLGAGSLDISAVRTHLQAGAGNRWDPSIIATLTDLLVSRDEPEQSLKMRAVNGYEYVHSSVAIN